MTDASAEPTEAPRTAPSDRVGPIIFSNETARQQLLRGRVITFRPNRRTVGETHARWKRTDSKQADVVVKELRNVDPSVPRQLAPFSGLSGFETVVGWRDAIHAYYDEYPTGWLYDVVLLDTTEYVDRQGDLGYEHAGVWDCECGAEFIVTQKTDPMKQAFACPDHGVGHDG